VGVLVEARQHLELLECEVPRLGVGTEVAAPRLPCLSDPVHGEAVRQETMEHCGRLLCYLGDLCPVAPRA